MRPEKFAPGKGIAVSAAPHPLKVASIAIRMQAGMTIAEIVDQVRLAPELRAHAVAFIAGELVPDDAWHRVRVKEGAHVEIRIVPEGPIIPLLALAASAFSAEIGAAILGSALASTVIFGSLTVGGLFVGALVSTVSMLVSSAIAPSQSHSAADAIKTSPTYQDNPLFSLSGGGNSLAKWSPIPTAFGIFRAFPPLGAQYFTEIVGNDQYLRMVVIWGYGPLQISNLQIGDTPIEEFAGVQIETLDGSSGGQALSLYPGSVFQADLSILLTAAGGYQTQRSGLDADELSVDIGMPRGLLQYNDDGSRSSLTVKISIEYRRVGDSDWTPLGSSPVVNSVVTTIDLGGQSFASAFASQAGIPISGMTPEIVRHGFRWNTPTRDQYDVRVIRLTADSTDSKIVNDTAWTALRTITNEDPIAIPVPMAKTAIVIKASDQLNGAVNQLSGLVKMVAPDWDSGSGTWITRATQSPASAFRWALQYPGVFSRQPDSAIDLVALEEWAEFCASKGLTFNQYRDYAGQTFDLLTDICAAGRGTPALKDGKWSVIWDAEQSTPVQYFTPRNSWNFRGSKLFPIVPHAYRVQFANELNNYAVDERVVYRTGFDATNATIFEQMQPIGFTNPDQVYKHAMFMFAQALLRAEQWNIDTDFEHLVCSRGSLVNIVHDVLLVGIGSGRIDSLVMTGPDVTGIVSDESFTFEAGKSYAIEVRNASNAKIVIPLTTSAGKFSTLTFTSTPGATIDAGDLFGCGIAGEVSAEALVTNVARNPDHGATLTLLPYSRSVYTSDTGTIPPYVPTLTALPTIAAPVISSIVSDESVLLLQIDGTLVVRCQVQAINIGLQGAALQVRIKPHGDFTPYKTVTPDSVSTGSVIFEGVNQGEVYDISARWTVPSRLPGPWSDAVTHTIIGKSTPPPPVDAVSALLLASGDTRLTWTYANPPLDWAGVNIFIDGNLAHSGVSGFSFVLTDAVLKAINLYHLAVTTVDTSGNEGTPVVIPYTRSAPPPVDTISVTRQQDGSSLVAWNYSGTTVTASSFELSVDGQVVLSGVTGLSAITDSEILRSIGTHLVSVVVVDIDGLRSAKADFVYSRGLPPDVTNFAMNPIGTHSYFSWDPSAAVDVDYYRIKYSPILTGATWASAADFIAKVSAPATTASTGALNGTFLIKVIDKDGNESENAALIETNIDGIANTNFVASIAEDPGFAGTKTGCANSGSTLILDSNSVMSDWSTLLSISNLADGGGTILPAGMYNFANSFDLGSVYTCRLTAVMEINGVNLSDTMATWPTLLSQATIAGDQEDAWRAQLQVRTTLDDPAGSPTWSDWINFVVGDYTMRAAQFRLLLYSDFGTVTPEVTALSVSLDMADRILSANDVSCPSGGLTVTYDGAFRVAPAVGIAGQGMATGDYFAFSAKDATHFSIRFFNASNVGVARTFDWIAKGYGKVAP